MSEGDAGFDRARLVVRTTAGEERADALAAALKEAPVPLEAVGVSTIATSEHIMTAAVIHAIEDSQVTSLAITLMVAMLLLVGVFTYEQRRPLLGVIAIVPVVLVVLWTFGLMANSSRCSSRPLPPRDRCGGSGTCHGRSDGGLPVPVRAQRGGLG